MRVARHTARTVCALGAIALAAPAAATAKVETGVTDRVLNIVGDDSDDRIAVTCTDAGLVLVNGKNPSGGPTGCAQIVEIDAQTGPGNDVVDFSGITPAFGKARFEGFGNRTGAAAVMGPGNDRYTPSSSAFNLVYGEDGKDRAAGGRARDLLVGGPGNDVLRGRKGADTLQGGGHKDRLYGGPGSDTISGNAGSDLLVGAAGGDVLGGGGGRDRLRGGKGNDALFGGAARDALSGGPGKNRLVQDPPKN